MAEVASASIRLVGAPRMPNGRKMSGLGIDFCDTSTPESPSHHWEEDLPHHPSFTYNGTVPPRTSRWSESTQQSRATKASSSRGAASRVSQSNSVASNLSTQQAVPVTQEEAYVSNIVARKRPSEAEVQAFIDGNYNQRSARGSDVSQNSYGPITPQDEHEDRQIRLASFASFGETPRKAPVPPQLSSEVSVDMDAKLQRRPSLTQSMMRTLGGRKKETRPPPPLTLVPPVPKVPLMPPSFELAPIIHRLERPVAKRSATRSSDSGTTRLSPPLASISPRPRTSSGRRSSGTAFSTLFRSVRKTMSRKSSKASPLIDASGKMSLTRSPVPSINGNAPSFVSIQVETSIEVQSTPSSPGTDRRAVLQVISPASQAGKAYSRPSTAPEGRRGDFTSKHHIPPYIQSVASSPASNASPVMRHEATPGSFDIQYRDPWKKLAGFEPASSYAQAQMIPPSPPSWVVSHQLAAKQAAAHGSEAQQDLLQVPASLYAHSSVDTGCSLASGSPTSVPSWTPMVALPSPDVSILHTPSRSFLELEASPSSAKYTFGTPSTSSKQGQAKAGTRDKSPFLLTPGQISMRDPWARSDDKTEDTLGAKAAGGFKLSRDDSDASRYSTSPAESSKSPQFNASPRARRPSRKAVPKIDEGEMLRSASPDKKDRAKEIYAGCRPFHRPSVDEQLSDMVSMKMPFVARSSLADVTEGRQLDNYFFEIPRSTSLAGRNASWSSDRGMVPPPHLPRPSFPTFETTYTIRRPSYASEMSNQSFPSKPTRFEFRRPTLIPPEGIRISFDAGTVNV